MIFNKALKEGMFERSTGHKHTVHKEKRNKFSEKSLNKPVGPKPPTKDYEDNLKAIKSGKAYLTKVNNIKSKL